MAPNKAKIASQRTEKGSKRTCPECDSEMEMTRVVRSEGPTGMFWVCTDYGCAAVVTKAGVKIESLELR